MALEIFLWPNTLALSGNNVWVSFFGDAAPNGVTGYMFMLKIESTNNMLTGAPFYEAVAPNAAGFARIDIQGYLDKAITYFFSYPFSAACIQMQDLVHEVTITGGIRYIDSTGALVETWNTDNKKLSLVKGGVSQRQIAAWREISKSFYTAYVYVGKFLTQRPQDDIVHPLQLVKLWNYGDASLPVTTLRLVCNYSDGTVATENIAIAHDAGYMHELNVNPYHNGVSMVLENGAKLLDWSAALYNTNTLQGDVRRFQYDYRYCERPFWLLFANSLGGIDDVYLSGYATEGFEVEGTTVYRPAQYNDTVFDRTLITPNKQGQNVWKINTGWKTATQMFHLRDLLVSREVWLIYPSNYVTAYNVIPVNITNTSAEIADRQNDLYSLDIELAEAHTSQFNFDNSLM